MRYRGENILIYHLSEERYLKLQPVLIRMGIKCRMIEDSQVNQKIGALFKLPGFELEEGLDIQEVPENEVLLMNGFSSKRLGEFLSAMRKAGVGVIGLKAIVTAENANWKFVDLYKELSREHEQYQEYQRQKKEENK
ncbi:hypothetical protein P261_01193 [Lachnospiraceae bacterium TWA4]|nr:hypothetical protein P261_01193 [Lachnospiraceae bacterium TWA4]